MSTWAGSHLRWSVIAFFAMVLIAPAAQAICQDLLPAPDNHCQPIDQADDSWLDLCASLCATPALATPEAAVPVPTVQLVAMPAETPVVAAPAKPNRQVRFELPEPDWGPGTQTWLLTARIRC